MCDNPKLGLVNMTANINLVKKMSVSSQDIEWKQNFGINQGPLLLYKFAKNDV